MERFPRVHLDTPGGLGGGILVPYHHSSPLTIELKVDLPQAVSSNLQARSKSLRLLATLVA